MFVRRVGALHVGPQPGGHVLRGQEAGPAFRELGRHVGVVGVGLAVRGGAGDVLGDLGLPQPFVRGTGRRGRGGGPDPVDGRVDGVETAIGILPAKGELKLHGLKLDHAQLDELLDVDNLAWQGELAAIGEYLQTFTPRLPERLHKEQQRVANALAGANDQPRREANAS